MGRNRTKADVLLLEWAGRRIVVKDFRYRGALVRNTIGRFSVSRELRAYERLAGLAGIADPLGRVDAHALAYAYLPGSPLPSLGRLQVPGRFFDELDALLASIHARGVAISDLHHRNVLLTEPSGAPGLIDFSLALRRPAFWNLPGRWLYARAKDLDRLAAERIRRRYQDPAGMETAPAPGNASIARLHALGRAIKRGLRRLRGRRA